LLRFYGPDSSTTLHSLPTERGVAMIGLREGHLVAFITLTLHEGLVHHIHAVRDPLKLAPIAERLGARLP
jgi:hypothetical protein